MCKTHPLYYPWKSSLDRETLFLPAPADSVLTALPVRGDPDPRGQTSLRNVDCRPGRRRGPHRAHRGRVHTAQPPAGLLRARLPALDGVGAVRSLPHLHLLPLPDLPAGLPPRRPARPLARHQCKLPDGSGERGGGGPACGGGGPGLVPRQPRLPSTLHRRGALDTQRLPVRHFRLLAASIPGHFLFYQ